MRDLPRAHRRRGCTRLRETKLHHAPKRRAACRRYQTSHRGFDAPRSRPRCATFPAGHGKRQRTNRAFRHTCSSCHPRIGSRYLDHARRLADGSLDHSRNATLRRPLALMFPFILQLEELCKLPWCQSERSATTLTATSTTATASTMTGRFFITPNAPANLPPEREARRPSG